MEVQSTPEQTEQPVQEVSIVQRLSRWYRSLFALCLPKSAPLSSVAAVAEVAAADAVAVAEVAAVAEDAAAVADAVAVAPVAVADAVAVAPVAVAVAPAALEECPVDPEEDDLTLSTQTSEQTTHE